MSTPPKVNTDLAGWWVVNHVDPGNRHAVIDPCPVGDPQCHLDRKVVRKSEAQKAIAYTVAGLDGFGDDEVDE